MTTPITPEIIEQVEAVREAGPVNMMDRKGVQYYADQDGSFALVIWIEDNPRNYMDLLMAMGS